MDLNNPAPFVNDYQRGLKPATIRWVMPGWNWTTQVQTAPVAGEILYEPIFVPERTTYDQIGLNVIIGDGVGGLCEIRIYEWAGGLPLSQIVDCGVLSTNAAGTQQLVINQTLERGYYFVASRFDQVPTLSAPGSNVALAPVSGISLTNSQTNIGNCVLTAVAAMADPAPAPTAFRLATYAFIRLREA